MSEHPPSDSRAASSPIADRGEPEAPASTIRLEELFAVVRRHLRLVLGVAAAAVAVAGAVAYATGSVYRAVAVIRLSDPRRAFTGGVVEDPALLTDGRYADPLLSQVELLKSHTVAGGVVDSMPMLRLVLRKSSPDLLERVFTRRLPPNLLGDVAVAPDAPADSLPLTFERDGFVVATRSGSGGASEGGRGPQRAAYGKVVEVAGVRFTVPRRPEVTRALLEVLSRDAAISRLLTEVRVRPRMHTDIVDVAYSAPDPARAQEVVNRVVDVFRATSADAAQRQSRLRREFLQAQLKVNDSLVAAAQQALTAFQRRAHPDGSGQSSGREQSELPGLELQRQQLLAERRTDADLLAALQDSSTSRKAIQTAVSTPGVAPSPALVQLNTQLFQYELERDSLTSLSPRHPDLPRLNQLIASTEAKLRRAVQAGVQGAIASLDGRIAAINDLRARRAGNLQLNAEEARLTERVDNARKVADELRTEYQKAGIAEAVTVGQVEIVDHAPLPMKPAGIGTPEQLVLGLLVGLMLGTGGAFAADHLGSSIARRVEVEHLGLTVLGIVPRCGGEAEKRGPRSSDAAVEAFRGIRLNVQNAYHGVAPLVVAVTSPGSGDGKSFVSSNLALAFAHANHRTLLIDADLRRGALHRALTLRRQPGVTDLLLSQVAPEQMVQPTAHASLDFLASGSRRRDSPELLGSPRTTAVMTHLRSKYDVIIVDTPPLGAGVDALVLASLAGGLLVVLRLGRTERELAEAKIALLGQLPIRVLGAILNDVREESEYYAYSYYMDGYELSEEPLFQPLVGDKKGQPPPVRAR
ncbi:MAG TPA: polysaccharide biosynthesis tyrosine autokinase [Gemmatimonadales bacterium]|nr:polysaccharide biosynthesis tyrosine autokinase [Gemmatimonadales bacterium]